MLARLRPLRFLAPVCLLAIQVLTVAPLTAAPGDFDPSFLGDGFFSTPGSFKLVGRATAVRPDGAVVLGGSEFPGTLVWKFSDSWPYIHKYSYDAAPGVEEPDAGAALPDNRVVLAGVVPAPWPFSHIASIYVLRLRPDMQRDTTFGQNGVATTSFAPPTFYPMFVTDVAVQPDGKVLVLASVPFCSDGNDHCYNTVVARFLANGARDLSFGNGGGKLVLALDPTPFSTNEYASRLVLQPDGKILVTGSILPVPSQWGPLNHFKGFVLRLMPNGTLDWTYGPQGNGVVELSFDESTGTSTGTLLSAAALAPDGGVFLGGLNGGVSQAVLAKLDAQGILDGGFGLSGWRSLDDEPEAPCDVVVTGRAGPWLVAGFPHEVRAFTLGGQDATSFGAQGKVPFATGAESGQNPPVDVRYRMAVRGGKLVAGGTTIGASTDYTFVFRLLLQ